MYVIKDPHGQTRSPASSDQYFHLKFVLFCDILKSFDVRTDVCTDNLCENNFHYLGRPNGSI